MTAPDTDHAATREARGRKVREAWVNYCLETGDTKPSHIAPWEELSEWDKEADRRIGDAVATVLQAECDEARRALAAERARVGRIKDLLFAVNDLATAVVDLLTDEQVEGPDYPNDLDERHAELAAICREYGDLTSDEGEAQS